MLLWRGGKFVSSYCPQKLGNKNDSYCSVVHFFSILVSRLCLLIDMCIFLEWHAALAMFLVLCLFWSNTFHMYSEQHGPLVLRKSCMQITLWIPYRTYLLGNSRNNLSSTLLEQFIAALMRQKWCTWAVFQLKCNSLVNFQCKTPCVAVHWLFLFRNPPKVHRRNISVDGLHEKTPPNLEKTRLIHQQA